jgi:hypothetical protein
MHKKINTIIFVCILYFGLNGFAQKQTIKPNLSNTHNFSVVNREISVSATNPAKVVVHLDGKPGDGVAWINNVIFEKGIIEFDVKGRNVMQQSFVGIAFHGFNDTTFDAVYFRPFNFQSPDAARKSHSVQYISLPNYDWSVLRQNQPGKYENALISSVEPESWFHAKVVVDANNITVYVNNDTKPSLVVKPLTNRTSGKIGFWVGNNSDGNFANLAITQ